MTKKEHDFLVHFLVFFFSIYIKSLKSISDE